MAGVLSARATSPEVEIEQDNHRVDYRIAMRLMRRLPDTKVNEFLAEVRAHFQVDEANLEIDIKGDLYVAAKAWTVEKTYFGKMNRDLTDSLCGLAGGNCVVGFDARVILP